MSAAAENYRRYLADPVALRLAIAHGEETMRQHEVARMRRQTAVAVALRAQQAGGHRAGLLNRGGLSAVEKRITAR